MRTRRAVGVDQQVLRPARIAERHAGQRACPAAARLAGRLRPPAGSAAGTATCSGSRRAYRSAPSSICSRWMARQVWKPLECAEMPRIACIATGRPIIVSCRRPAHRSRAGRARSPARTRRAASSAAMRRIVAAGMPHRLRPPRPARSARRDSVRPAAGTPARARRPSASMRSPISAGARLASHALDDALAAAVPDQRLAVASRANRPSSAAPGSAITSQPRVGVAGEDNRASMRSGAQQLVHQRQHEQAVGARADADPLVGDRRNSRCGTGLTETNLAPRAFSLPRPILIGLES